MSAKDIDKKFKPAEVSYSIQAEPEVVRTKRPCGRLLSPSVLKLAGATLCIAGAVATWVAMAEALQKLNNEYKKPYFMIFFVHSSYAILYVGWSFWKNFPYCFSMSFSCNKLGEGFLTNFKSLAVSSGVLGAIAITSGYTWYLSLTRTNIPANTAIYQSTAAIVFVISVPLLKERVTLLKVFCVLVSIGGVFMVSFFSTNNACTPSNTTNLTTHPSLYDDEHPCKAQQEKSTPLGYVFLVMSIICYALFETFYKRFATAKDDPAATLNGIRFLGYMGVHTVVWMWPPILILHFSGFEVFAVPYTMELFGLLVLNAILDIVFNACLLICIALSSPLYAAVGTIVAIPTSVVVDLIVHHFLLAWQAFVGIVLILIGFTGFVISEAIELRREARHRRHTESDKLKSITSSDDTLSNDLPNEEVPLLEPDHSSRQQCKRFIIDHLV